MSEEKKKHAGGRPPKYTSAEEMQVAIDAYFESCFENAVVAINADKTPVYKRQQIKPYTVMGLSLALGMCRDTLCEYAKNGKFSDTIKQAKSFVECSVEERLLSGVAPAGTIFWLKNNANYKDKTETELTGKDGAALNPYSELDLANRIATLLMKAKKAKGDL